MITALACKVLLGAGVLNLVPGIVQSPRYADAAVTIELHDGVPADLWIEGPIDKHYGYIEHGLQLTAIYGTHGWLIDIAGGMQREHLVIDGACFLCDRGVVMITPARLQSLIHCPVCQSEHLYREEADVGVGIIYGPYGCGSCGWSEWPEYDARNGDPQASTDGYVADQFGGLTRRANQ